jgi:glyceraldehyde-3-phosphate dehydrogenase (NADP+)
VYHDVAEALEWIAASKYGLQTAVFGYDPATLAPVVDALSMREGRVNINAPDVLPFTGKKNSALVRAARAHVRTRNDEREGGAQALLDPTIVTTTTSDPRNLKAVQALVRGGKLNFFNNAFVFPPA